MTGAVLLSGSQSFLPERRLVDATTLTKLTLFSVARLHNVIHVFILSDVHVLAVAVAVEWQARHVNNVCNRMHLVSLSIELLL